MRTIKRQTAPLNLGKQSSLKDLCKAYASEKLHWLDQLRSYELLSQIGSPRKIRDQFVRMGYQSVSGLQGRHWKIALQDAIETWDKYWQALFVKIRPKIFKRSFNKEEIHYAFFLMKGYKQFAELMQGGTPVAPFELKKEMKVQIAGYVRRLIKRFRGKSPTVKKARSVKFDANCYNIFEHKGRQYIKLMSLKKGERIILPLKGKSTLAGNLTVVLSKEEVCVHTSQELGVKARSFQNTVAVDLGYTEVMTDQEGERYGKGFGKILTEKSDSINQKNQQRNKLYALNKDSSIKKRKHICKYNLGRKKLTRKKEKWQASLKAKINQAIHQLIKAKQPSILITEDLSHLFVYKKSSCVNRRLSSWLRGEIQSRISFKALAEGFRHEQVNPAYGSQICPKCGFVDSKNRTLDKFTCLYCRHEDTADRVAAQNYAKRFGDLKITLYTPYREVKTILLDRFHRRLEEEKSSLFRAGLEKPYQGIHPLSPVEIIHMV